MKSWLNSIFVVVVVVCSYEFGGWLYDQSGIEIAPKPCHYKGVDLIEYGVGVTNCGDTIPVKMPGDLYREFKEKQDE